MSISVISGNSGSLVSSDTQSTKVDGAKSSNNNDDNTKISYSGASISELEALAAKGDAQAQAELARRKASEGEQKDQTSSINTSGLSVTA